METSRRMIDACFFNSFIYKKFFLGTGIATSLATFRFTDGQPSEIARCPKPPRCLLSLMLRDNRRP